MPQAWSVPGTCRVVCVPLRSPRPWKLSDARRIARYVHVEGTEWITIVAAVMVEGGLSEDLCRAAGLLDVVVPRLQRLTKSPQELLRAIRVLSFVARLLPRRLRVVAAALVAVLQLISKIPVEFVAGAAFVETLCEEIRRL